MYLQDRAPGRTPRWRGATILHEMKARGIPVAVSSDNTRDPFYAYGDLDAVEVYTQATRIAHLDHPVGDWPMAIARTPADTMGQGDVGRLKAGGPADLVLFRARSYSEFLSRPQHDRAVLRAGIAEPDEVPAAYGVIVAGEQSLEMLRPAPKRSMRLPFSAWMALARVGAEAADEDPPQARL